MVLPADGGSSMPLDQAYQVAGFKEIHVDIKSLSDFAHALRQEFEVNLKPAWDRMQRDLGNGPQFGFSSELDLGDKRDTYDMYLTQARRFLMSVAEGVRQLADAADQIGANYSKADQFAKLKTDDVNKVLPEITTPQDGTSGNTASTTSSGQYGSGNKYF